MKEGLLDAAPAAVLSVDMNGVVLAHNAKTASWLGDGSSSLVGRNLAEWFTPTAKLLYETQVVPRLVETGRVRELVLEIRRPAGDRHPLLVNADRVVDDEGAATIVIAAFDASARVRFEYELVEARRAAAAAHRELALLQRATGRLAVATGVDDLGAVLVDAASDAMQAAWTAVRIAGPAGAQTHWGSSPIGMDDGDGRDSSSQLVCRSLADIDALVPDQAPALRTAGVESLIITPIVRSDTAGVNVIGDIRCWFRRPRTLGADETETLIALARQAERVVEHLRLHDRIRHSATHDTLTGLPNRAGVVDALERTLAAAAAAETSGVVLFLDLDGFKAINDRLGHTVGDEVLKVVADRLVHACRPGDVVGRLGGDEFLIVADGVAASHARGLAERVRAAVRVPLDGAASGMPLSTSIGVAVWDGRAAHAIPTADRLIAEADAEMYQAKRAGKDGIRIRGLA